MDCGRIDTLKPEKESKHMSHPKEGPAGAEIATSTTAAAASPLCRLV